MLALSPNRQSGGWASSRRLSVLPAMRLNWDTVLVGKRVVLVPYRERYVAPYHTWMQDDALLEQTASERLTLAEERANQASWRDDDKKLTFIVLAREACFGGDRFPVAAMAGDCNLFLDRDGAPQAEVEVMVAERKFRRRGFGAEAVELLLAYASRELDVRRFFAKVGDANGPSRRLFEGALGFQKCNYVAAFKETELERVVEAPLPLAAFATSYDAAPAAGFAVDEFGVSHDDGVYACAVVLFGARSAFCWVGRAGEAPNLGALVAAGPRAFECAAAAATALVDGDGGGVGAAMAQRLSRASGRVVLVAWSLGDGEDVGAARVERELARALPPFGCGFAPRAPAPEAAASADLFGDDSDDDGGAAVPPPPPPPRVAAAPLPAAPPSSFGCARLAAFAPAAFDPVYVHPALAVVDVPGVGGGRGYAASRDLPPGALLLCERPLLARAETYDPSDAAACLALAAAREPAYAAALAKLHPVGDAMDFARLLDVWRFNAFESGLYPRRALFNDARDPTCAQLVVVDDALGPLAEVWTCRAVAKGDALTLSYVQPAEATAAKRHAYTNAHHDFAAAEPGDFAADEALERDIDAVDEAFEAVDVADAADAGRARAALGAALAAAASAAARLPERDALRRRAHGACARVAAALSGARVADAVPAGVVDLDARSAADGVALRHALAWLRGLEAAGKADHPDAAPANGIAGDALRALAATRAAPVVARVAGAAWATAAEVHAALAKLDAAADRLKRLYDARRWIADECA